MLGRPPLGMATQSIIPSSLPICVLTISARALKSPLSGLARRNSSTRAAHGTGTVWYEIDCVSQAPSGEVWSTRLTRRFASPALSHWPHSVNSGNITAAGMRPGYDTPS